MKITASLGVYLALVVLFTILVLCVPAHAVYVQDMPITLTQPDGQILKVFVTGDEFYHYVHDHNGYVILPDEKTGYYVYAAQAGEDIAPTKHVVGKSDPEKLKLKKHVKPSKEKLKAKRDAQLADFPRPDMGLAGTPQTGTLNNIVIFIRFSDQADFTSSDHTYISSLLNDTTTGASSMRNYYQEASYSQMTINSTVYPTLGSTYLSYADSHPRSYYSPYSSTNTGGYTTDGAARLTALFVNAVNYVKSQISTSLNIDADSDGNVDNVVFMIKGTSDNWNEILWPRCGSVNGTAVYINGKRVWTYNEQFSDWMYGSRSGGVLCHEMGHSLGLPDLYHYTDDGIHPAATWDLMNIDQTPPQHMTAHMKWKYLHWISNVPQITTSGTYTLHPLTSASNNCYKIASPYSSTEYFMVEYRRKTGTFESSVPGSGLIVYRINSTLNGNAGGPPDELYIYRPGGTTSSNGTPESAHLSATIGRTQINDYTTPTCFLGGGGLGGLDISNVTEAGDTISFQVGFNQVLTPNFSPDGGIFPSAQAVTITCATPGATIRYTTNGTDPTTSSPTIASGGTITISSQTTLKARAWVNGLNPSFVKSAVYGIQDHVYVDQDAPGSVHNGLTWATAMQTVQDGIDLAKPGVSVWVAGSHTYYENITVGRDIALYGGFAGTETALSQRNWVKNVTILDGANKGSVITIPGGATWKTRVDGFTIQHGNGTPNWEEQRAGGGIYLEYSAAPRIACNIITSNTAEKGGAIYCEDEASPELWNNVICSNSASEGGGLHCEGWMAAKLTGNTIVSNTASVNGGGICYEWVSSYDLPVIKNNLIALNSSGIYRTYVDDLPSITYNCLYGNAAYAYGNMPSQTGLNNNINAYPSFVNSAAGDYHLAYGSGCIDMASNVNLPLFTDRDGGDRAWDGNADSIATADIGAYEFRRVYVKSDSPGPQNGTTWAKAFHTVQDGINAGYYGDEVWVAGPHTYTEHIILKDGTSIYGGFAGTETSLGSRYFWQNTTILDGAGTSGSVVTIPASAGPATRVDGFTIQNGSATSGGGVFCGSYSVPVITNNKIGPNSAQYGGAIYCSYGTPSITGNLLTSNTATYSGAGIYCFHSAANISYNTIAGNSSHGVFAAYSNPTLSSNIIAGNGTGVGGSSASPIYYNNDVWGNTSGNYVGVPTPIGNGNISADPSFLYGAGGDYHLTDGSPCVDKAKNTDRPIMELEGRGRQIDGNGDTVAVADIGAYEFRRFYVDQDSSSGMYDGSTWQTAYHTIVDGLNAARAGDEVWVAGPHTYFERITLKSGVGLFGGFLGTEASKTNRNVGGNNTVLDGGLGGTVVTAPSGCGLSTRIDGFTIQNGQAAAAGGINCTSASPTISGNRIIGNRALSAVTGYGGGIYCSSSNAMIVNNVIDANIANCSLRTGTGYGGGAYCTGGSPSFVNNTFYGNNAGSTNPGQGGAIYLTGSSATLKNNIFMANNPGVYRTGGTITFMNNDAFGNTSYNYSGMPSGTGNITLNPTLLSPGSGNYHLSAGSPCIDSGAGSGVPNIDRDGFIRPLDGNADGVAVIDIGAYESPTFAGIAKQLPDGSQVALGGVSVTASFTSGTPCIYVESIDRSSGIRVDSPGGSFVEGQLVDVNGFMATDAVSQGQSGERHIDAQNGWVRSAGGSLILGPLGMNSKSVGGSNAYIPGTYGLDNMGLLVRTWGRVSSRSSYSFYLDDGSGVHEPGASPGVYVYGDPTLTRAPAVNQVVAVTAISTAKGREVGPQHVLKPRGQVDVKVISTPTAYIRGSDTTAASSFKALLDSEGFHTDLMTLADARTADFSKYALIIVGSDTGAWSTANDTVAATNINNSGRPIVAIETGGSRFFSKLSLNMATNTYNQGLSMYAKSPSSSVYHNPYEITISMAGMVTVTTSATGSTGWFGYKYLSPIPGTVEALGSNGISNNIMLARESSRYVYWPFRDRPDILTTDGKHLFINACWYALN